MALSNGLALQWAALNCMALSNGLNGALHWAHGALQWAPLNCMALSNGRHFIAWRSPMGATLLHGALQWALQCATLLWRMAHGALQWAPLYSMALSNGRHFIAWRSPMGAT